MSKPKTVRRKTVRRILLTVLAVLIMSCAGVAGMCLLNEKPAVQTFAVYQDTYRGTAITIAEDGGVEILPQNCEARDTGIIFYVGALIDPDAYVPLLSRIAEKGYPCFIPDLRLNMALMESNAAEEIIKAHPEIQSWVMAGHSLGGFTASGFVDDRRDEVDGLILLAAYTARDISDAELPTLSVYGNTDGVLNMGRYEKCLSSYPSDFEEQIIPGANHAQFGDYGKQSRDHDALISADEQQAQTAEIILDWLDRHEMNGERNG